LPETSRALFASDAKALFASDAKALFASDAMALFAIDAKASITRKNRQYVIAKAICA
jgi:hypothetical protein